MEHHLTLETGNYFLLGISPSVHFFLEYPMENIQIHSVLVLNLLLQLWDQLRSICYPHRICRLQTAVLLSHLSHQLCPTPPNTPLAASHSLSPAIPASTDSFAQDMLNNSENYNYNLLTTNCEKMQ